MDCASLISAAKERQRGPGRILQVLGVTSTLASVSLSPDQAQALNPGFGAMAVTPLAMVTPPATADLTALVDALTYLRAIQVMAMLLIGFGVSKGS